MPVIEESCVLLLTPAQIWPVISDFVRWKEWLVIKDVGDSGAGNAMKVLGGEGAGQILGVYYDKDPSETVKQTGRIAAWTPPTHFALTLDEWNPETGRIVHGRPVPGPLGRWIGRMRALRLRIDVMLEPVSPVETKFTIRYDAFFSDEFFGRFLNLALPHFLGPVVKQFVKKFQLAFDASAR